MKPIFRRTSQRLVIGALIGLVSSAGYSPRARAQEPAEQWEDLAAIQMELATGYEALAERRGRDAVQHQSLNDYATAADYLNRAGDEKFIAFESFQKAKTHWENAGRAYGNAGDELKAKEARGNAEKSREAAKRMLREGAEIYKSAANLYDQAGNLEKKWEVMMKLARNLERLIGIK